MQSAQPPPASLASVDIGLLSSRDNTQKAAILPDQRVFRSAKDVLYLTGGSNDVASLYTEEGFAKNVDSNEWQALISDRAKAIRQLGSMFAQLVVPEKLAVYPLSLSDHSTVFPGLEPKDIVPPGRRLVERTSSPSIVYPDSFLVEQAQRLPIYMPTDSHWTWQGAFSAFQLLMSTFRRRPDYKQFVRLPKVSLRYHGDLWEPRFADLKVDAFERVTLPASIHRVYANQIVGLKEKLKSGNEAGLHMGSHCIFANSMAEFREAVIIFGSSFSECRLGPSLLTSIFANYFETVHFIWSTSVDLAYIERHKPSITLAEIPERFLTLRPSDTLGIEEISVDKLRAWNLRSDRKV